MFKGLSGHDLEIGDELVSDDPFDRHIVIRIITKDWKSFSWVCSHWEPNAKPRSEQLTYEFSRAWTIAQASKNKKKIKKALGV